MAFAPTKGKKHLRQSKEVLSLTSMMDMMTIILLFLLKSFATSGALLRPSPFVTLPAAAREIEPKKEMVILINPSAGVIKGEIADTELTSDDILSGPDELGSADNVILPGLQDYLINQRELAKRLPTGFSGKITIQCDSAITYDWLLKVINTCGQEEFNTLDFVIYKKV